MTPLQFCILAAALQIHIVAHLLNVQNWACLHRASTVETVHAKIFKGSYFSMSCVQNSQFGWHFVPAQPNHIVLFFQKRVFTSNSDLCSEDQRDIHSESVTQVRSRNKLTLLSPQGLRHCHGCTRLLYERARCYWLLQFIGKLKIKICRLFYNHA